MLITKLINDENGFLISTELIVIFTLMLCGTVVGFAVIRDSLVMELHDASEAIGAVSQSYNVTGIRKARDNGNYHARCSGFGFNDNSDDCDCKGITLGSVCGKDDPSTLNNPEGTNN
jgi:hypothetical protein